MDTLPSSSARTKFWASVCERNRWSNTSLRRSAGTNAAGTPDTKSILAAFKTGSNHPNFLSHPYTCDGQQMTGAPAICNDYYLMNQVKSGQLTQPSATDWTTSKGYYMGQGL